MWLVLGATVVVASVFAGRSERARLVARAALGVLFLVFGAVVNVVYLVTDWDSFAEFGEMSQFAFVRETWASLVAPNTGVFIGLLIAGEATAGILVLCGGTMDAGRSGAAPGLPRGPAVLRLVAVAVCRADARRAQPAVARRATTPARSRPTTSWRSAGSARADTGSAVEAGGADAELSSGWSR